MPLQKQTIPINFAQGLDTKTDPKQLPIGRFLRMVNSRFDTAGLLSKRFGFDALPTLPEPTSYLTTFNGNLTAIGQNLIAYSQNSQKWISKGMFQPLAVGSVPVVRSALSQIQADSMIANNGLICTVFTEQTGSTKYYKYVIQDPVTGQNIVEPTAIPVSAGTVSGSPRVFLLGNYFIIVFTNTITAVDHLQYIAVSSINPTSVSANADIASVYDPDPSLSWDAVVVDNKLFVAYNTSAGGQQVAIRFMTQNFVVSAARTFAGSIATTMSVTTDTTGTLPVIYAAFYDSASSDGYAVAVDTLNAVVMSPTQYINGEDVANVTCTAQNGVLQIVYEVNNAYAYDSTAPTNYLNKVSITKPSSVGVGTVGVTTVVVRSVGLASKGVLVDGLMYMLAAYDDSTATSGAFQPTYFFINLSGEVIAKLAYTNGGGYVHFGLPKAQLVGTAVNVAYLFRDLVRPVNKTQGVTAAAGVYSQTGVNVASLDFSPDLLSVTELGNNLNISGGFLYAYDGNTLNEQNFHIYPDFDPNLDSDGTSKSLAVSSTGGDMITQDYFYVALYEWTDAQGNIIQSAPSVPAPAAAASFTGSTNSVVVSVPTCRLTYKPDVKIVIFRWSTAQQTYFQVTSITSPTLNNPAVDVVTFTDTLADEDILGNSILYTTGGVLENNGAPACTATTSWDTRQWIINAENKNELRYSKTVTANTPVEMSEALSKYISPNAGAQGNTGPMWGLAPMDDKLIIFKENALFYINGTGPDLTGANSQYSEPIYITSPVGSTNQRSIVTMPRGIMFQSDKGIWLLGRDLSTSYIGAAVEAYNQYTVTSASCVPATTQVRFTLSNGIELVYDYFYDQWDTDNINAASSTLYQKKHTFVTPAGRVSQESSDSYLDSGVPVLMSFTTGWINLAGVQGFQRAYFFYLIGQYFSPHKLRVTVAYDYNSAPTQSLTITPTNTAPIYGNPPVYGQVSPYGGTGNLEQWRIFLTRQKCEAFQISVTEIFDPTLGVPAGKGFTLSGINLVAAIKKGYYPLRAANSAGGSS